MQDATYIQTQPVDIRPTGVANKPGHVYELGGIKFIVVASISSQVVLAPLVRNIGCRKRGDVPITTGSGLDEAEADASWLVRVDEMAVCPAFPATPLGPLPPELGLQVQTTAKMVADIRYFEDRHGGEVHGLEAPKFWLARLRQPVPPPGATRGSKPNRTPARLRKSVVEPTHWAIETEMLAPD